MMVYELLSDLDRLPSLSSLSAKVLMTVFSEEMFRSSLLVADRARKAGINLEVYLDYGDSLTKQLDYANKKGFDTVLILGPEEKSSGQIVIKDLSSGRQKKIEEKDLIKALR
jgi:histidyl-tRNA synthetase